MDKKEKVAVIKYSTEKAEDVLKNLGHAGVAVHEIRSEEELFEALGYETEDRTPDLDKYRTWTGNAYLAKDHSYRKDNQHRAYQQALGLIALAAIDIAETLAGYYGKRKAKSDK
jgi:hypothetical protein